MTTQDYQELIKTCLKRGMVKAASAQLPTDQLIKESKYHKEFQRRKRQEFISRGLTTEGTPRKRVYERLTGFTPEQKHERQLQQQKDWNIKHRKTT